MGSLVEFGVDKISRSLRLVQARLGAHQRNKPARPVATAERMCLGRTRVACSCFFSGDAFLLVFAVDDAASFEQVVQLRDEILSHNNKERRSIIVVANKADYSSDLWRIKRELAETLVSIDWELAYVECSAKDGRNIIEIFRRIMLQCKIPYELNERIVNKQRRKSLPVHNTQPPLKDKALLKRNSCNVS